MSDKSFFFSTEEISMRSSRNKNQLWNYRISHKQVGIIEDGKSNEYLV